MVLVVPDPLRGAGRAHPLGGRAVTVSKFLVSSCADFGCRVSVNKSMDSGSQSGFRGIHQKSRTAVLQRFCDFFLREDVVEKSMSIWSGARASAALMSLGRVAEQ